MLPLPGLNGWEDWGPPQLVVEVDPLSCALSIDKIPLDDRSRWTLQSGGLAVEVQREDQGFTLIHPLGVWSCTHDGPQSTLSSPRGTWRLERRDDRVEVHGPGGLESRLFLEQDRLVGWLDPGGGRTELVRNEEGRITRVEAAGGPVWSLDWDKTELESLRREDGSRWGLRDGVVHDPTGRSFPALNVESDRGVAAGWTRRGDRFVDGAGRELHLLRDAEGRVVEFRWGGSSWRLQRDALGKLSGFTDPSGMSWSLRWSGDRVVELRQPDGQQLRLDWSSEGLPLRIQRGAAMWTFQYRGKQLHRLQLPWGGEQRIETDAAGRVTGLGRADGSYLSVQTDGRGDLTALGDLQIRRDEAGRPLRLELGNHELAWYRDGVGRVVRVEGEGLSIHILRDAADRLGQLAGLRLERDSAGRLVGAGGWRLERDGGGRILARVSPEGRRLEIRRDPRGREVGFVLPEGEWTLRRDGAGKVLQVAAPGTSLGMAWDSTGSLLLLRYPALLLRALERSDGADFSGEAEGGGLIPGFGWKLDSRGRLGSRSDGRRLSYDPVGGLSAVEEEEGGWSVDRGGVSGPGESRLDFDEEGRPQSGNLPGKGWGLGSPLRWELGPGGRVERVLGPRGVESLVYDTMGRLESWTGTAGTGKVERDPFGNLVAVNGESAEGWGRLLSYRGAVAMEPGLAWAGARGRGLWDPNGEVIFMEGETPLDAQGRIQGPLGLRIGLLQSLDPIAGTRLGPGLRWPWAAPTLLPEAASDSPWVDPDAPGVKPWWSPEPWAPRSAWADPLSLLVALGELPHIEAIPALPSGLAWYPEPTVAPAPLRASSIPGLNVDALTERLITRALGAPLAPEEPLHWILEPYLVDWPVVPGLEDLGGW